MLAQRLCQVGTMNGNTARPRLELHVMAEMKMKPPTDFPREPRFDKLALNKGTLGRYGTRNGLQYRCLHTCRTVDTLHFIW